MSAQFGIGKNDNKNTVGRNVRDIVARGPRLVLPALAALGIGGNAGALELGPVKVQSTIGEPLRASIAYALRPHEEIAPYCIRLSPGRSNSGMPSAGRASVTLRDGRILLDGVTPVAEPVLALQLTVDCPYAAHLSREYVVFVDPERPAAATPAPPERTAAPAAREATARPAAARTTRPPKPAIDAGSAWRVQRGDSLSEIAARISGRQVGLWEAVDLIFAANPDAFLNGDRNLLRAGVLLHIPDAIYGSGNAGLDAASAAAPDHGPAPRPSTAYGGYAPATSAGATPQRVVPAAERLFLDDASPAVDAVFGEGAPARESAPAGDSEPRDAEPAAASPRPGDVLIDAEGLFVSPIRTEEAAAPQAAEAPPAPAPSRTAQDSSSGAWSWLLWLAGSGIALILGLLLFGRTLRRRFGTDRAGAPDEAMDPRDADDVQEAGEIQVDYHFGDAETDARMIRVDVDLDEGTGFQDSGDIDVAQDFGFSASGGLELGLDVDFSDEAPAKLETPRRHREGEVIVEQEIPPGDPTVSEYDLSMIVDATRQSLGDTDDTEKDLHAIQLEDGDIEQEEEPFTLSREVDYKILEQDYEDELTVTQMLAAELSSAARDLVGRLYDEPEGMAEHELPTAEMPAPGLEVTAELPQAPTARADESGTVEMLPAAAMAESGDTDVNEDLAVLPDAGNDADMEVESATVDTKKLKAS